jgi:hypothetical protein
MKLHKEAMGGYIICLQTNIYIYIKATFVWQAPSHWLPGSVSDSFTFTMHLYAGNRSTWGK